MLLDQCYGDMLTNTIQVGGSLTGPDKEKYTKMIPGFRSPSATDPSS